MLQCSFTNRSTLSFCFVNTITAEGCYRTLCRIFSREWAKRILKTVKSVIIERLSSCLFTLPFIAKWIRCKTFLLNWSSHLGSSLQNGMVIERKNLSQVVRGRVIVKTGIMEHVYWSTEQWVSGKNVKPFRKAKNKQNKMCLLFTGRVAFPCGGNFLDENPKRLGSQIRFVCGSAVIIWWSNIR